MNAKPLTMSRKTMNWYSRHIDGREWWMFLIPLVAVVILDRIAYWLSHAF